jgi:hypothetical protein
MKGIIYEIKCNETNEIYIGSTTQFINQRISEHKYKTNCVSKQIIERNNYSINILEEIEIIDIKELRIKEQNYIDTTICINKMKAFYTDTDKNLSKINKKIYYQKNKEKLKEYKKQYYQKNKDKIKQYYQKNKIKSNNINGE